MLPELEPVGRVRRPFLGIRGRAARDGLLVGEVPAGTPAAARGIKGGDHEALDAHDGSVVVLGGDVLTGIDGHDVHRWTPFTVPEDRPGQKVLVELEREGKPLTRPSSWASARAPRRRPPVPNTARSYHVRVTRAKICGITRHEDAELAVELGAWAIGMIRWGGSRAHATPRRRGRSWLTCAAAWPASASSSTRR